MSDLERQLEELHSADARAWRVRGVGVPRRRPWISVATFIGGTAVAGLVAVLVFYALGPVREQAASPVAVATPSSSPSAVPSGSPQPPVLAPDGKSIVQNGQPVLSIDNAQIVEWFRTQSQRCDANNIAGRRAFCTDTATFRDKTLFASISSTPDGMTIGFTIKIDPPDADTVAAIFARSSGKVTFLTASPLNSRFISFSPSGTSFVYEDGCFEARCGLDVRDTATLAVRARLNPPPADARTKNATFVRWISDNAIEYRLGDETKTASF